LVGLERLTLVAADRELQDLRELLERAALDGELWRTVCDRLADFLGGVGTVFVPEDLAVQGPWLVASASLAELIAAGFRDEWHLRNYRRRAIPIIKRRGYATDLDIADAATMRRDPFYAELLAPRKIGNFVGLNVAVGDQTWIASVQRASDAPPPDEALIARAKQALPALAAAARSSLMLGRKRFENWKDVIDEESRGVFLVDHLGRLIDRNAAAEIFLKTAMRFRNRTLHLSDPRQDVAFQHMLAAACSARASEQEHLPPPVLWTDEEGALFVADCMRLKPNLRAFHRLEAAMIIVRAVGKAASTPGDLLKRHANLTDAEIRLALALFDGQSLSDHAAGVGTTVGTVRQQLKAVFRKTQTRRQAELVTWMRRLLSRDGA
jgi:DNA-binding CsgD family transcriptional regulator